MGPRPGHLAFARKLDVFLFYQCFTLDTELSGLCALKKNNRYSVPPEFAIPTIHAEFKLQKSTYLEAIF